MLLTSTSMLQVWLSTPHVAEVQLRIASACQMPAVPWPHPTPVKTLQILRPTLPPTTTHPGTHLARLALPRLLQCLLPSWPLMLRGGLPPPSAGLGKLHE
jgi:hypothetical protein